MSSQQYLSGDLFSYTNGAYEFSVEVLCCEVFKFLGKDLMDFGIRTGKSLNLGMPRHPNVKFKSAGRHPLFHLLPSVTLLGAIFLFTT